MSTSKEEAARCTAAKLLTRDEARHIAANIPKLPKMVTATPDRRAYIGRRPRPRRRPSAAIQLSTAIST
jgi:hypothetical protein